jgi:hypothetical protein
MKRGHSGLISRMSPLLYLRRCLAQRMRGDQSSRETIYRSRAFGYSEKMASTYERIGTVVKVCGLAAFLTAMPFDVLTGHTHGFIGDPDQFQGWKIVIIFGILFIYWGALDFNVAVVVFVPILLAAIFTLVGPFIDFSPRADRDLGLSDRSRRGDWWRNLFLGVGALSLVLTAILFATWPDGHWDSNGHFFGAYVWLGGASAVVIGAAMQAFHDLGVSQRGHAEYRRTSGCSRDRRR